MQTQGGEKTAMGYARFQSPIKSLSRTPYMQIDDHDWLRENPPYLYLRVDHAVAGEG
jgi:hypothetical protein